ncbi:MAG: MFS transporter [Saprospiraceae bacterium]
MLHHLRLFFINPRSFAIGISFFVLGFLFGNFATLIPHIKSSFEISDGILGLMLLCPPLGAMTFNPVAAILIRKYSAKSMTIFGMINISLWYALPILVNDIELLPFALVMVGVSMTTLNISVNTLATELEKLENINILSTCHGLFSIGLMLGALMRSLTLIIAIGPEVHMLMMSSATIALTLYFRTKILQIPLRVPERVESKRSFGLIIPKGMLLTVILISICINVTEGAMADWTAVYMKEIVKTSPYFVGWGLFGYSAAMATGRLFGDSIIPMYGNSKVLTYGAVLAFFGVLVVILFPYTYVAIGGFALIGLGVSCGSPILYASASRYPDLPEAGGLAIMNTYAMAGFLVGPVIIGFISDLTSLSVAFGFIAMLSVIWFVKAARSKIG